MKNNDMTLINDYLEYELEPALNDIINTLPQMISMSKGGRIKSDGIQAAIRKPEQSVPAVPRQPKWRRRRLSCS